MYKKLYKVSEKRAVWRQYIHIFLRGFLSHFFSHSYIKSSFKEGLDSLSVSNSILGVQGEQNVFVNKS